MSCNVHTLKTIVHNASRHQDKFDFGSEFASRQLYEVGMINTFQRTYAKYVRKGIYKMPLCRTRLQGNRSHGKNQSRQVRPL